MENELEDSEGAEEEPDCFVRVTGICRETTEDALLNFFLNTRRSGGGEIKDSHLKLEEGVADITFLTNEVAERVAQKDKLVLDGCKLTATLITAPKSLPIDERSVHVKGMSENTTKDGLVMYMEVVSGEEVENVLFGDTCNAMVMFKEPPDFEKLIKMCSKKSLDGKSLIMEQVNMCDCIEVTSLSPKTTKDAILYYFENSRNGGGDVRKLEYDEEAGRAVVLFDDPSVVDVVIKQDHVIDGAHLTINHYYAFLGEISQTNPSGGKTDKVIKVNPNNLLLIKEFFSREFDQLLQKHQVMYKWQEGSGEIVLCCVETKMDEKTWENSCEAVVAFINQMVTEKITISQEIWEKMAAAAKEKCVVYERQISIQHVFNFKAEKENSIILRGKKTDVSDLAKQLQDLVSQVEEQIMIEKSKITEKIKVSDVQMALINFSGFVDGLTTRHEGLEVSVISDSNDQVIQLRGLEEVVNECTAFVWETLSRVKESEMKFSNSVIGVLGSERGKAFILTSFKNNKIEAIISFDSTSDTQLMIIAMDRDHMNKAVDFLKNTLAEKSIPLDTDQKQLIGSDKWKVLKHSIQQSMLLQVTEEPASSTVCIAGIKQEVEIAKERVEEFFDNNIISNRVIEAETGRVRFLFKFRLQSMKNVEDSLKKHSVKVLTKSGESDGKVVVSGTKEGIKQAVPRIEMLIKNVKDHTIMLDAQGSSKMNNDKEWLECLREFEKKYSCVIEQSIESKGEEERWRFGSYFKERTTNIKIHMFADDNLTLEKVEHEIKRVLKDDKNEDAERVSRKESLDLDGSNLTITLKEIPKEIPKDPNKLHVMGISEKTTKEGLESFMEVVSGEEVESIFFGSNSNAMVTFKEPPDIPKVQKKCSTRALDGSHLKIEQVNICDCIEVTGLAPNTTKDTVFYYFDNPRNGGGEVENVEMDSYNKRALVFFKEPPVVNTVVQANHTLNGAKLKVVPFYPFLGESSADPGGGKKEIVKKVDPEAMAFINKFENPKQEFDLLLQESRVKYTWEEGSGEIIFVCADPKMDEKTWENSCEAVFAYINQIVTEKVTVSKEAWKDTCKKAKEKCASFKTRLNVICKEKEYSFTLTGKQVDVSELAEHLNDLSTEIQSKIEFEKNKTTKSIAVTEAQLELLNSSGFVEYLQARFKNLEVKFSNTDGTINLRGPDTVVREGNLAVWQTVSKVKEADIEPPKSIVGIVGSQAGKTYMATKFKKGYIDAVVNCDSNSDNQLVVTAVDRRDAKKAVDLIKDLTSEQSIPLDDHHKQLIQSDKWKQLKHSIQHSMLLQITEEPAASTLWIAGIKEEVDKAMEKVDSFFKENIILEQVIDAENGRLKFIYKYRRDVIQSIEKSLTNQSVKIMKKTDGYDGVGALVVSGTRDGVHQAVPNVQKLIDEIKDRKVDLEQPGMKSFFSERKGITLLSVVENEHNCIIERCTPTNDTKQKFYKTFHENKSLSKLICSFVTPEGKTILLYKGDLTEHKVDVMVNAANESLKHIGGLAKSILLKGGQEIQEECDEYVLRNGNLLYGEVFVSKPGNLPCKRLVHAVGPRWGSNMGYYNTRTHDNKGKKALLLGQTVYNSLEKAEMFSSIAIPAISAGIFGCPVEVCAKTLIESALEYSEEKSHSRLSEIHFVDMNDSVIKAFHDEMKSRFSKENSFKDGATPKAEAKTGEGAKGKGRGRGRTKGKERMNEPIRDEPAATSLELESAGVYDDPNSLTTAQGMKILVVVGDLAKEEAHAVVNTVASNLDLSRNPCARALSDAAGPQLQQECNSNGSLSAGQVLVTDGYNLGCKNVFHVVAGDWQNGQGEPILHSLIQSCFKEADKRGFSSIAFPAIGTGNLAFPRDVVARAFFEEADAFKSKNPQSPLNEIHLVLFHKDQPTIQAFQDELKSRKPKVAKGKRRSYVPKLEDNEEFDKSITSREPIESFVAISQEDVSGSSYIGSVRLEIISGDITKETTDAIVTISNPSLNVSFGGGVGAAISKAGGPSIQKECNKLGPQKPGSVVATSAGNLPTKNIFHLALVSTSFVSKGITDVMVKCFLKADDMGITSIAVPAIGTGMGGISPKDAAKGLLSAIGKFSQENPTSVSHIRIVIFQEHILQVFDNAIEELSESKSSMLATLWKGFKAGVKGMFGFGEAVTGPHESIPKIAGNAEALSFHPEDKMWLQIYAASDKNLKKAETDILNLITENSKTKEIDHKAIGKLSDSQRSRVMKMEITHHTKIRIDQRINRIVIRGVAEDVSNATVAVYDILNERSEEEHSRRYAELLSKNVQWYYEDGDKWERYDDKTNAKIEHAFNDKKNNVLVSLQEGEDDELTSYKIDFNTMIEKNLDTGDTARVERRDKTAGVPLPVHWDTQPKGSDGKELDLHMVVLDPVKHKKEYDDVKGAIEKTTSVNIIKIERVQNPGLYSTYAVKKQKMDDQNRSNEKKLFHGTAAATCQQINHKGFNRSFCGKNATMYGKGVYFALDASYSARSTYSPPDPAGNRYMYMASVLVGEYTVGQNNMITPPAKSPNNPTITYDSVVDNTSNPSIFVVFHDTQNYPDYLITFK